MIQVIPPFGGATTRFRLKKKDSDKIISVYFDDNDSLGYMRQPYWEAYPIEGDASRYLNTQDDFDIMIAHCVAELERASQPKTT